MKEKPPETVKELAHTQKRLMALQKRMDALDPTRYRNPIKYEQAVADCRAGISKAEAIIHALERPLESEWIPASMLADYAGLKYTLVHELAQLGELGEQYDEDTRLFPRSDLARLHSLDWRQAEQEAHYGEVNVYFEKAVAALAAERMEEFAFNRLRIERRVSHWKGQDKAPTMAEALYILEAWFSTPFEQLEGKAAQTLAGTYIPNALTQVWLKKGVSVLSLTEEQTISRLKRLFPWAEWALQRPLPPEEETDENAFPFKPLTAYWAQTPIARRARYWEAEPAPPQTVELDSSQTKHLVATLQELVWLAPSLGTADQRRLRTLLQGVIQSFRLA